MSEDTPLVITKLEAACRQLEAAIRMYFDEGDAVVIHTLACAAREIFEKHCKMSNRPRMFDEIQENHSDIPEKELWNVLNRSRNFFKHPDPDGDLHAYVEFSEYDNKATILIASFDCASLLEKDVPVIFQRYMVWFVATEPGYRKLIPRLADNFPGLDEQPLQVQRALGKTYVCGDPT